MTTDGPNSGLLSECYGFRHESWIILDTCWKEYFFGTLSAHSYLVVGEDERIL